MLERFSFVLCYCKAVYPPGLISQINWAYGHFGLKELQYSRVYSIRYITVQSILMFVGLHVKDLKETVPVKNSIKDKQII